MKTFLSISMAIPTQLMLALSAAVMAIDPSVPAPCFPPQSEISRNAEHWMAVASYAEAFPRALAKKVGDLDGAGEEHFDVALDGMRMRIVSEARTIRWVLVESAMM